MFSRTIVRCGLGVVFQQPASTKRRGGTMDYGPVELDAEPDRIALDLARSAVLVVDMQNDFGSQGGIFDHAGIDISIIRRAIDPTRKVLAAPRNAVIKIIDLKMGFRPDLSDLGAENSPNRWRHLRFGVV